VIQDILNEMGLGDVVCYTDDREMESWGGKQVIPRASLDTSLMEGIIISIGNNQIRKKSQQYLRVLFYRDSSKIDRIQNIGRNRRRNRSNGRGDSEPTCKTGKHNIINTGATIDHECILEDYVHISPNATLCGNVRVGEGTHIGAGAVVNPNISIGKWCVIGSGSVVIRNVPDHTKLVGNPAKPI